MFFFLAPQFPGFSIFKRAALTTPLLRHWLNISIMAYKMPNLECLASFTPLGCTRLPKVEKNKRTNNKAVLASYCNAICRPYGPLFCERIFYSGIPTIVENIYIIKCPCCTNHKRYALRTIPRICGIPFLLLRALKEPSTTRSASQAYRNSYQRNTHYGTTDKDTNTE
jgi:hypothetical protein